MQNYLAAKIEVLALLKNTADVMIQLWQETWDMAMLISNRCICSQAILWFEGALHGLLPLRGISGLNIFFSLTEIG